jgi:hypothetical protein
VVRIGGIMGLVGDRWIRKTPFLGTFKIVPHDSRFYALYEGEELVCVTVYKTGAMALMNRLHNLKLNKESEGKK